MSRMGGGHPGRRIVRMPFDIKSWRGHKWAVAILAAISHACRFGAKSSHKRNYAEPEAHPPQARPPYEGNFSRLPQAKKITEFFLTSRVLVVY